MASLCLSLVALNLLLSFLPRGFPPLCLASIALLAFRENLVGVVCDILDRFCCSGAVGLFSGKVKGVEGDWRDLGFLLKSCSCCPLEGSSDQPKALVLDVG